MTGFFPEPYKVGWHAATTTQGGRGTTTTYAPALDAAGTAVPACGIQPAGTAEPNATRVEHDLELLLNNAVGQPDDVVDVFLDKSIGQFHVDGYVMDSKYGPFAPGFGGVVVKLKRVQR